MRIILASGSPRRRQLMELAGIPCEIIVSNADETVSGPPDKQVRELALRKAYAVADLLHSQASTGKASTWGDSDKDFAEAVILAADTLVYIDGQVLGKPQDFAEAFAMLKSLSGRKHTVYTGVALLKFSGMTDLNSPSTESPEIKSSETVFADSTDVFFHTLTDEEIRAYIATGEPFDKAGAYGVQERGAVLVDRVEGDFYTVVGLPISKVFRALSEMGCDVWGNNA
ncbi:MAG: Maf family protein [Defluviitaleaceae bacterium]|nr:Maf family protein [Defluviitaleaceae bacterium]